MFKSHTKLGIVAVLTGIVGFTIVYKLKSFLTSPVTENLYQKNKIDEPVTENLYQKNKIDEPVTETPKTSINISNNLSDNYSKLIIDTEV